MFQDPEIDDASESLLTAIQTARSVIGGPPPVKAAEKRCDANLIKQLEAHRAASQRKMNGLQQQVRQLTEARDKAEDALAALRVAFDTQHINSATPDPALVQKLEEKIMSLEKKVKDEGSCRTDLQDELREVSTQLKSRDDTIRVLQEQLVAAGGSDQVVALRGQVAALAAEAMRRDKIVDAKTASIQQLQQELDGLHDQLIESSKRCAEAEARAHEASMNAQMLEATVTSKSKLMERLQTDLEARRRALDAAASTLTQKEHEVLALSENLDSERAARQEERANSTRALRESETNLVELRAAHQSLAGHYAKKSRLLEALSRMLTGRMTSLTTTLQLWRTWAHLLYTAHKARCRAVCASVERVDAAKAAGEQRAAELHEQLAGALRALDAEREKCASLEQQLQLVEAAGTALQSENAELHDEMASHLDTANRIKKQLEEERREREVRERSMVQNADELRAKIAVLEAEGVARKREVEEELAACRLALDTKAAEAQQQLRVVEAARHASEQQYEALSSELAELRSNHVDEGEKWALLQEIASLRSQVRTLERSMPHSDPAVVVPSKAEAERVLYARVNELQTRNTTLETELQAISSRSLQQCSTPPDAAEVTAHFKEQIGRLEEELGATRAELQQRQQESFTRLDSDTFTTAIMRQQTHRPRQETETLQHLLAGLQAAHRDETQQLQTALERERSRHLASGLPVRRRLAAALERHSGLMLAAAVIKRWSSYVSCVHERRLHAACQRYVADLTRKRDELQAIAEKALRAARAAKRAAAGAVNSIGTQTAQVLTSAPTPSTPRQRQAAVPTSFLEAARAQIAAVTAELNSCRSKEAQAMQQLESAARQNEALVSEVNRLKAVLALRGTQSNSPAPSAGEHSVAEMQRRRLLDDLMPFARRDDTQDGDASAVIRALIRVLHHHLSEVEKLHYGIPPLPLLAVERPAPARRIVSQEKEITRLRGSCA